MALLHQPPILILDEPTASEDYLDDNDNAGADVDEGEEEEKKNANS